MLKFLKRLRRRSGEPEVLCVQAAVETACSAAATPAEPAPQQGDVSVVDWLRLVLGHLQTEERHRLQQRVLNSLRFGDNLPKAMLHAMLSEGGQHDGQWAMLLVGVDSVDDVDRQGRELARSAGIAAVYGWEWHEGRGRTTRASLFALHAWLLGFGYSLLQMDTGRQEHCMLMTTSADADTAIRLGAALGLQLTLPRSD
jgi:hypothetical protein